MIDYYVYIVQCSDGNLYTGYTKDLKKRLDQHNGLVLGGARYTRARRPVSLVYTEKYPSKREAMQREYQIKELSHAEKMELI